MPTMEISNDGIAVIDGVFSDEYCQKIIEYFEQCKALNASWDRSAEAKEMYKQDESCNLNDYRFFSRDNSFLLAEFNNIFFSECYAAYIKRFSVLDDMMKHGIYTYKIQKTLPTQGYHIWHCEVDGAERCRRLATYILYLNDVDQGGETEFLYLSRRIKPKAGRLVIFPAGYIHTHRGNPPLTGEKYILTGWLEFME